MLKSIIVTNDANESLKLELSHPWDSRVIIESVDGLTPTKGTINTNALATSDGSVYNSARKDQRNIVLNLALLEDDNDGLIETTRQKLYRYFPVKKKVRIDVITDNRSVYTEGYVETNEPDIFQENEKQQISIICPNANWTAPAANYILNGVQSMFEFPFSNESLTENLIIFGEIVHKTGIVFNYPGDIDSGVVMYIHAVGECINPVIKNVITKDEMIFDTSKIGAITGGTNNLINGDTIICSSVDGDKYVTFIRGGKEYNAIALLPKNTEWLEIRGGSNAFSYDAEEGGENMRISIQTQVLYGGV